MTLAAHLPPEQKRECIVDKLTPEHLVEFVALIGGHRSQRDIAIALRSAGYQIAESTVGNHRAGQCVVCRLHDR